MTCDLIVEQETESSARPPGLPEGVPPLTTFYLYLTNGCNLACRHCWITPKFVNGEPDPGDCLDLELLKKAVREAKPLGLQSAKLTGGEPTLHPQFVEIADYLTYEGLSLTMETNGTLIDAVLARHLKEKTSLWHVSVSIDGPSAEVHDPFRGVSGSFDAAVRGLRALVNAGYRPQVIMSLHRGNAGHVAEMVRFVAELGAGSLKFNPVMQSGRGITMHANNEDLKIEELLDLVTYIRGELQASSPINLYISTPLALYSVRELVENRSRGQCHVLNILGILGSGDMALCGIGRTVPDLCYGSLQEVSVGEAWLEHPMIQQLRSQLSGEYPGICRQCIHARQCLTWCVALNYVESGSLVAPFSTCQAAFEHGLFPLSRLRECVQ